MTYVYDILLNFNEYLFDFYEWNTTDNLTHVRKIPIFKMNTNELKKIANNIFDIDKLTLRFIMDKTEVFTSKKIEHQKYMCLFSDGNEIIALKFNDKGRCFYKSKMLVDEEGEALEVVSRIKKADINIRVVQAHTLPTYKTRKQIETQKKLTYAINKFKKNKQTDILEYLYFECTNEEISDIDLLTKNLQKLINTNKDNCNQKLDSILKLISANK